MGLRDYQSEAKLRNKDRQFNTIVKITAVFILLLVLYFFSALTQGESFLNFIFMPLNKALKTHPALLIFAVYVFFLVKGYMFGCKFGFGEKIEKKLKSLHIPYILYAPFTVPFRPYEKSRVGWFENWAFRPMKQSDSLPRRAVHKTFTGEAAIEKIFDFNDDGGTDKIIEMFKYDPDEELEELNKRFEKAKGDKKEELKKEIEKKIKDLKFLKYKDLFDIIEGVFEEYEKVKSINVKLKSDYLNKIKKQQELIYTDLPCVIQKRGKYYVFEYKNAKDVYNYTQGKILFSSGQIKQTVQHVTELYVNYLKSQLNKPTRIRKKYAYMLDDETIDLFSLYFRFVYFRKLMLLWLNLPAGWFAVRVKDYNLRRIISTIDRDLIIYITKANGGKGNFSDDRLASAFLFTYHAFFKKSYIRRDLEYIEFLLTPDKNINETELLHSTLKIAREDDEKGN